MVPTEIVPHGIPIPHQLPATPPCSPRPSTPEQSRLGSQAKSLLLLQSAQAPTIEDLEHLSSQLVKAHLPVMTGESMASELGDREIHSSGDDTPVTVLPLFDEDGWEPIGIFQDSDSDLSREASSDGGFSDTSTGEASSETSSDGDSSEASEQYIDIDLLDGYEYPRPDLADNTIHHTGL
ncbi:hypothetical protein DL98DRAFT_521330 [Cadophora sp. DSE1049]|nr:hypothetical protein DL98DRAFT_521330 [Cadophora sp. DSE1049]